MKLLSMSACVTTFVSLSNPLFADVFPNPRIAENDRSVRTHGKKRALYFVVHSDDESFTAAQWDSRVQSIRNNEIETRRFFSSNSGGRFDIYYDAIIVDAPIPLNADGTRPTNWRNLADGIATGPGYGLNLSNYFLQAYDVNTTVPDANQGWGGLSTGRAIYLQANGTVVTNHEIGHQITLGHAKAIRQLNDEAIHPYYWDTKSTSYKEYFPGESPYTPVPFGAPVFEYGNPFDTMGNMSGGDYSAHVKHTDLEWLSDSQTPSLNDLGQGSYRLYAHDELLPVTNAQGDYGVKETYRSDVLYGLSYQRQGYNYSKFLNSFLSTIQTIDLEYRAGTEGLAVYLDGDLVDMDPRGGQDYFNAQRLLNVGNSMEDANFGMATFYVTAGAIGQDPPDDDFLSFDPPPPPSLPNAGWLHIAVLDAGVDAIGSYIDLQVAHTTPLNGHDGDLDQNGELNADDIGLLIAGWKSDTRLLDRHGRYMQGDMDLNGMTDLADVGLFRDAWSSEFGVFLDMDSLFAGTVPEPSSATLLLLVGGALAAFRCRITAAS